MAAPSSQAHTNSGQHGQMVDQTPVQMNKHGKSNAHHKQSPIRHVLQFKEASSKQQPAPANSARGQNGPDSARGNEYFQDASLIQLSR